MTKPPFYIVIGSEIEKYRHDTWDTKEPETIEWIKSFDPTDCFWDIGANIGIYSLFAASLSEEMTIYSFEPMEANYQRLRLNRSYSELKNILTFRLALGDKPGLCNLEVPDKTPGATGAQIGQKGHPIRVESVDNLLLMPEFKKPDHVKIDIDGQEIQVIKGTEKTLPFIKSVLVEVSRETKENVMILMFSAGFDISNIFNSMTPHSRERRAIEGIDAENIIFTRRNE